MSVVIAVSLLATGADLLAAASIVAMGWFGYRYGMFLAILAGLVLLTALCLSLGLAPAVAAVLVSLDCPEAHSLAVSFIGLFAGVAVGARLFVNAVIGDEDVRWSDAFDKVGGLVIGGTAGVLLGGAILIGWSMCELPDGLRLSAPAMRIDVGARALWTFVRWAATDHDVREGLFYGDLDRNDSGTESPHRLRASEPFDDIDGDQVHDESEPYLDYDRSGNFTSDLSVVDRSGGESERRDVGLIDRYWLSCWRRIHVVQAPLITPIVEEAGGAPTR